MNIAHIAIWTDDLEAMKDFYTTYFGGVSNEKYVNTIKKFESYFITFDSGARLELMHKDSIIKPLDAEERIGITHIAFSLGSTDAVLSLTERLRTDGIRIVGEPRTTGDGYFESVILDLEGNRIELIFK
jgi:catechol 2,3-dioxygenase-like lactoylglutathione lyase family enzyme